MPLFDKSTPRNNWIAVASAEHARRGCEKPGNGFMQVCHGKCAPLKRVKPGDRVAYYAPAVTMGGKDRLLWPPGRMCRNLAGLEMLMGFVTIKGVSTDFCAA